MWASSVHTLHCPQPRFNLTPCKKLLLGQILCSHVEVMATKNVNHQHAVCELAPELSDSFFWLRFSCARTLRMRRLRSATSAADIPAPEATLEREVFRETLLSSTYILLLFEILQHAWMEAATMTHVELLAPHSTRIHKWFTLGLTEDMICHHRDLLANRFRVNTAALECPL